MLRAFASIILLAVPLAPPAIAQSTCTLANGDVFKGGYVVEFWKRHPAGTVLPDADASARAPGLRRTTARTFVAPRSNIFKADADLISRKLGVVLDALMAQPSLRELHGVSIIPTINMRRASSGLIEANLTLMAYPIHLEDPATFQRDGGYFTPGEGTNINVLFNTEPARDRDPGERGVCYGSRLRRVGNADAVYVIANGRPLAIDEVVPVSGRIARGPNPHLLDAKVPATQLQFLDVQLRTGNGASELARRVARPTDNVGRIYAATFMTDWNAVVARMQAVR